MNDTRKNPIISVVLGTYNRLWFLKQAIRSVRQEVARLPHEIIVIDGGSTDGTLKWLVKQKDIITVVQHNRGEWDGKALERRSWGYFMNLGFKCAQGKYICLLSDDCLVVPGAINNGYQLFEENLKSEEKVGAVAFYWRNWPEQRKYCVGLTLGNKMFVNHGMFLKKAVEDVGFIDENTFQFYHADGDLCLKLWQKGYACIESSHSYIEHHMHANESARVNNMSRQPEDWNHYLDKWRHIFYDENRNNIGGWIEKDYTDITLTASKFNMKRFSFIIPFWLK